MKRFCAVAVLMLLGSPAHAGKSFSFVIGGHHIHIETSRHCNSASCVSVSIPGIYEKRARFYRDDDDAPNAPPPAPVAASVAPPTSTPQAPPVACAPAVVPVAPVAAQIVTALQPQIQPAPIQPATIAATPPQPAPPAIAPPPPPPPPPPAIARPAEAALAPPPAAAPPRLSKVVHRVEEEPDSPLGDWQTEGHKGLVRIEPCGQALCGYVLDSSTDAKGETRADRHEVEGRGRMVRQYLQPRQRQHLLRDHDAEGAGFAAGRSLRARPLLLLRQRLEPDRETRSADHLPADIDRAAIVGQQRPPAIVDVQGCRDRRAVRTSEPDCERR